MNILKKNKPKPSVIIMAAIIFTMIAGFAVKSFFRNLYYEVIPNVKELKGAYPVVLGREENAMLVKIEKKRPKDWVNVNQVSKEAVRAILIAEDSGFYQHKGYEPDSIRGAIEHNQKPGVKVIRGGSTITQQVAKNIFLTQEKTITRKIRELLIAKELERTFKKREILEFYLNIVEWGKGIYGIHEASYYYFSKHPSALTAREGAILAFMLPSPRTYQHSYNKTDGSLTKFGEERVADILHKMYPPKDSDEATKLESQGTQEPPSENSGSTELPEPQDEAPESVDTSTP